MEDEVANGISIVGQYGGQREFACPSRVWMVFPGLVVQLPLGNQIFSHSPKTYVNWRLLCVSCVGVRLRMTQRSLMTLLHNIMNGWMDYQIQQ